ncbi:unnamed protein product [Brachionus calyciflorus]|uniref:Uncharacterized protein n=1 Tax=Brachionus calyciflorus TaxID=104777 RepID=A0A814MSC2_9BILA|nr:unnamed protein product [Brachionus calyciflorus]
MSTVKFEYVLSNQFKAENDDDNNVVKDGYEVLSEGFLFSRNKKNKLSNRWVLCYSIVYPKSLNGNDSNESYSGNEELVASSDEEDTLEI